MQVRNLNGTSSNSCNCGSWLNHWFRHSGKIATSCAVVGCKNPPAVGGHVQKSSLFDMSWYIAPLCSSCNAKWGQTLNLYDDLVLVSANVSHTCGR
jgi:hypothetical protein